MKLGIKKRTACRTVGDLRRFLVKVPNKVVIGVANGDNELFPIFVRRETIDGTEAGVADPVVISETDEP